MPIRRVAEDVFHIPLAPRDGVNAYLLGDIVVDAGTKGSAKRLIKALHGHTVGAHALTHAPRRPRRRLQAAGRRLRRPESGSASATAPTWSPGAPRRPRHGPGR